MRETGKGVEEKDGDKLQNSENQIVMGRNKKRSKKFCWKLPTNQRSFISLAAAEFNKTGGREAITSCPPPAGGRSSPPARPLRAAGHHLLPAHGRGGRGSSALPTMPNAGGAHQPCPQTGSLNVLLDELKKAGSQSACLQIYARDTQLRVNILIVKMPDRKYLINRRSFGKRIRNQDIHMSCNVYVDSEHDRVGRIRYSSSLSYDYRHEMDEHRVHRQFSKQKSQRRRHVGRDRDGGEEKGVEGEEEEEERREERRRASDQKNEDLIREGLEK